MSSCYKIVVSFCLPNDRREVGERVFGEWNNNHGVFLSVKVLSFVLVKSYRSPPTGDAITGVPAASINH